MCIGFCFEKEFNPENKIGKTNTSVGFYSDGKVLKGNKVLYDYQKCAQYGDCMGIGINNYYIYWGAGKNLLEITHIEE